MYTSYTDENGSLSRKSRQSGKTLSLDSVSEARSRAFITLFKVTFRLSYYIYLYHHHRSKPHSAGTLADYETVLYTAAKFEEFGISTEIKRYDTLLSKPKYRMLQIVAPPELRRQFNLDEPVIPGDKCTADKSALPPFIAYSPSGNVTGHVIYVNYGSEEDFLYLQQNGVPLKGKIALARYGTNFRGLKVFLAQKYQMKGVLIYSDPADDGFGRGKTYPDGPWRPSGSVQRGSGQFISLYSGDPLTPGYASVAGAPRLSFDQATNLPKIPVLPLSYGNAIHLLRGLGGSSRAPDAWQGGLDLEYHIGPTELQINLNLIIENKIGPIWNVIGTIRGDEEKDRYVILGNHRDAWVCGAVDPNSGSSAMLEIARGYGELLKKGWKPRRSIVLASWDGEEYGLLGSTEWAEENSAMLYNKAVAYLNVDCFHGKSIFGQSSPAIAEFLLDTAKSVENLVDENHQTLYDTWMAQFEVEKEQYVAHARPGTVKPPHPVDILGSGTDFTPFYQHLGIVSANLGFDKATYGVYHSSMDSIMWVDLFGDPKYAAHVTTARWWGLLGLRLANENVLPFDYRTYGLVLHRYINEFEAETNGMGLGLDFTQLRTTSDAFLRKADQLYEKLLKARSWDRKSTKLQQFNDKLMFLEREFLSKTGLVHRPWYKHLIFGPGFYTGYGATAFPGIADALALNDTRAAFIQQVRLLETSIAGASNYL